MSRPPASGVGDGCSVDGSGTGDGAADMTGVLVTAGVCTFLIALAAGAEMTEVSY